MDAEHHEEWRALQDDALTRLRSADAYSIFRSIRDELAPAKAHRRIWRRPVDLRKFETPVARLKHGRRPLLPTIEVSTVDLPLASVLALLERIVRSPLPPYTLERTLGVDGTSYEVAFGRLFVRSEFHWWESSPAGWEPLRQFLEDVKTLVDEAVRNTG